MLLFLDTSALVKLYIQEAGTRAMLAMASSEIVQIAISQLGELEFRATMRARERSGALSNAQAESILEHFGERTAQRWLRQPMSAAVVSLAAGLLDVHRLRAPDALQLASGMALRQLQPRRPLQFACSDAVLLQAAQSEGVPCWDPTAEEPAPG